MVKKSPRTDKLEQEVSILTDKLEVAEERLDFLLGEYESLEYRFNEFLSKLNWATDED